MILLLGANGQLGRAFCELLKRQKEKFIALDLPDLDITDYEQVQRIFALNKPLVCINSAAFTDVEQCEISPEPCSEVNVYAVENLARVCNHRRTTLLHFSTDYVFDGNKNEPYTEMDTPIPLNHYGKSKLLGEIKIRENCNDFLIFRLSWLYGLGKSNFIYKFLSWSEGKKSIKVVNDEISIPTSTYLVAELVMRALKKQLRGLFHLTCSGYASRFDWARAIVEELDLGIEIQPARLDDFQSKVTRPKFSALDNSKIRRELGVEIPFWKDELKRHLKAIFEFWLKTK